MRDYEGPFSISGDKATCFRENLLDWADDNLRTFPWRETDEPYRILIAEFLLQRTQAKQVEPVYEHFINHYPNFRSLSGVKADELADILRPLGLQNKRSTALVGIANRLRSETVPRNLADLMNLPYIGRYGANAVLCFAFDEARPIVDRNIIRIYDRVFDLELDYRSDEAWDFAEWMLPGSEVQLYNFALLDFGAQVCSAPPDCGVCFANGYCIYYNETIRG